MNPLLITVASVALAMAVESGPAPQTARAQSSRVTLADTALRLHVGGLSVRADDSQRGSVFGGGDDEFTQFIYADATRCGLGTSTSEPTATPRVGWRVTGKVTERNADGLAAEVEWTRLWHDGRRVSDGPRGTTAVTMRAGERLRLDEVVIVPDTRCDVAALRLEVAVSRGPFSTGFGAGSRGFGGSRIFGVGRGATAGAGGTGASATASGGGRGGVGAGAAASAGGGSTAVGVGGSGTGTVTTSVSRGGDGMTRIPDPLDLEIWLVHVPPGGGEAVQRVAMLGMPGGAAFEFPRVPVGPASVGIGGQVEVVTDVTGARVLRLTFSRTVFGADGRSAESGGRRTMRMPGHEEVVSFELPPATERERPVLGGHQFQIRLRVGPAKEQNQAG